MTWLLAPGDRVDPEALEFDGACQVRDALDGYPFGRLIEARAAGSGGGRVEVVVVEVEPELPQAFVYEIRPEERLAITFDEYGRRCPRVLALREGFPAMPHLNSTRAGAPKDLCIYEDPWAEVRLRWTGAGFIGDIVRWLSRTATGELHDPDQPFEPFLFGSANAVVFPPDIFEVEAAGAVYGATFVAEVERWPVTLKLEAIGEERSVEASRAYCVAAEGTAVGQAAMSNCPDNLVALGEMLSPLGIDLWQVLVDWLTPVYEGEQVPRDRDGLVILIRVHRQREARGPVESIEHLAFGTLPIRKVALATGRFEAFESGGRPFPLLRAQFDEARARAVPIEALRPIQALDRCSARRFSGLDPDQDELDVVLVGGGALGSQVHNHLSRMGWGRWTVVDVDTVLPHNVVRHRMGENAVGFLKARALKEVSQFETPHNPVERAFAVDVLGAGAEGELLAGFRGAGLIVDASASIAVGRFLGRDLDSGARRVSVFLNPTGGDAVMLMEDSERSVTLDALEAQYYRAVLRDGRLERHILRKGYVRYSAGCRDVTARLAQDDVALASGLLARQLRSAKAAAIAAVWQNREDGTVGRVDVPISDVIRADCGGWSFLMDTAVVDRAGRLRCEGLPRETGGVLLGYFDALRRCVYVVDALRAPPDSVEHEVAFIRGSAGLQDELKAIRERTAGQVGYVGEWHSHPDGADVCMSPTDAVLLGTVAYEMRTDGWPGVMMIVGTGGSFAFYTLAGG